MIKILHTADWHIGKVLHKHSLEEEMQAFLDWLLVILKEQEIDVLLVSGDIFDLANPAAKDRAVYYTFLSKLAPMNIKVIITGGNHDGIGVINAPSEVLDALNISVIGGATEDISNEIVEVKDEDQNVALVVAAVPFLRDKDLRKLDTTGKSKSRIEAIREGIKDHYQKLADICDKNFSGIPAIAMGHLYAKGASTSDSERDIHIGNAAAVESSIFPKTFGYTALGHIHRPQIIGKDEMVRYSGSPIPLSFSERKDEKGVLVLTMENDTFSKPQFLKIPQQRELRKFSGSLAEVSEQLKNYKPSFPLPSLVELEFKEEDFSSITLSKIEELVAEYKGNKQFKILKSRTDFKSGAKDTSDLFTEGENIEDLSPQEVFAKRIEGEDLEEGKKALLEGAFLEILELVQSEES